MKKILKLLSVEDYHRDMSNDDKLHRDNKILVLLLLVLVFTIFSIIPLYASVEHNPKKFQELNEWICPNRSCGYDNYDGIRYCGLCGTERGSRRK